MGRSLEEASSDQVRVFALLDLHFPQAVAVFHPGSLDGHVLELDIVRAVFGQTENQDMVVVHALYHPCTRAEPQVNAAACL